MELDNIRKIFNRKYSECKIQKNGNLCVKNNIVSKGFINPAIISSYGKKYYIEYYRLYYYILTDEGETEVFMKKPISFSVTERYDILSFIYDDEADYDDLLRNTKIILYKQKSLINFFKHMGIYIYDENRFLNILKLYVHLSFVIAVKSDNILCGYTGWTYTKYYYSIPIYGFLGVTNKSIQSEVNEYLFNSMAKGGCQISIDNDLGDLHKDFTEDSYYSELINKSEAAFNTLAEFFRKNPIMILALAYNVLAVGAPFVKILAKHKDNPVADCDSRFAFAVFGKNKKLNITPNKVANIFFNSFSINYKRLNSIDFKNAICSNSNKFDILPFTAIKNIPLLVSSKNYNLNINSSKIKKIIDFLRNDKLDFYPVFVSKNKFSILEAEEINIADINYFPAQQEELEELKNSLNIVIISYIYKLFLFHLPEFYNGHGGEFPVYLTNPILDKIRSIQENEFIDSNKEPAYIQLYIALSLFFHFMGSHIDFETIREMKKLSEEVIMNRLICDNVPEQEDISNIELFFQYINDIFTEKKHTPKYIHWIGRENKGKGEECYYLDYNSFFDDFCRYVKKSIERSDFNKSIKVSSRVITSSSRSALGLYRTYCNEKGCSKKIYCLVIRKNENNI